jgi:hypothetical protein
LSRSINLLIEEVAIPEGGMLFNSGTDDENDSIIFHVYLLEWMAKNYVLLNLKSVNVKKKLVLADFEQCTR